MRIARVSAIAGDGLVARASIERNGFGPGYLRSPGEWSDSGARRRFLPAETAWLAQLRAPMAVAHIHALYFDGTATPASRPIQKHTARCTEIRGAVERGNQFHCFRCSGVRFDDLQSSISERKLKRHLEDPRIERAGDLAEGRRTESSVDARSTSRKEGQRDAGAEAVAKVESLGAELQSV